MKTKINKFLGVLVTLAVAASLFVAATPVSAGIQSWTSIDTPSGTGFVVSTATFRIETVGKLVYNSDKTVIYATAVVVDTTTPYTGPAIFKSTNGGRTWTRVNITAYHAQIAANGGIIFDLMTSTVSANELYFTDGAVIYTSKNGGTSWTELSSLYQYAFDNAWANQPVAFTNQIVTLDMAVLGSVKMIFAGTATFGSTDSANGVFLVEETVLNQPWSDLGIIAQRAVTDPNWGLDVSVWDVTVDPTDFAVKQGVFAVATFSSGSTYVTAKYAGQQWNQVTLCRDAEILQTNAYAVQMPIEAEIWLPSDFNSSLSGGKFQAWIGLATLPVDPDGAGPLGVQGQGDVYIWTGGATQTIDLNIAGPASSREIHDIDGVGTIATAKILVGGYDFAAPSPNVWYSADGIAFTLNTKPPTGGINWWGFATCTVLALDGFATNGQALAGTGGLGGGVSYTDDFAKTFNQISLMRATVAALLDLGGDFYIVTTSLFGIDSVWELVTIGGVNYWERITSELHLGTASGSWDLEAAADGTLFIADVGGVASVDIYRSFDGGVTWQLQFNNITSVGGLTTTAWMPVNANSVLVGGPADTVYYTTTNGIIWTAATITGIGTITDFAVSGSNWYAVGVDGVDVEVAKSSDNGATWTKFTSAVADAAATMAFIAAEGSTVYMTKDGAGGVYRSTGGTFTKIDGATYDADGGVSPGTGIVFGSSTGTILAAEGTGVIYATDSVAGQGTSRVRGSATQAEAMLKSGVTFTGLWLTKSGTDNVLWTRGSDTKIWTYTDTLNKPGTGVTQVGTPSGSGFVIYGLDTQMLPGGLTFFTTTISWTALPNATSYTVHYGTTATAAGLSSLYSTTGVTSISGITTTTLPMTLLAPNATYYVSVWADEPVSSFMYGSYTFSTPPPVPNWTPNLSPMSGSQNVQVGPTGFDWDDVIGATGYEFQIAAANGIPAGTATVSLTQSAHSISNLAYDTFYTWRVRAMSGTVAGDWVTSVFTTEAAPPPPATTTVTTINIPTQTPAPVPTINLPQPTVIVNPAPITVTIPPGTTLPTPTIVLPEAETPIYIWIIVAVGALLTIAVIVLIVRTRRVV